MNFELQDFRKQVLEASQTRPVVVDFWAPWCGPCKMLTPILEQLATASGGRWLLVKINVDEHGPIASQFGVQGIPAVFMVFQGGLAGHFTGAQSKEWIQDWLEEHLPDGDAEEPGDTADASGDDLEALEAQVQNNPEAGAPRISLAKALMFSDPDRASAVLAEMQESAKEFDLGIQLGWLCELLTTDPASLPDAAKIKPHFVEALEALKTQNFQAALDSFLEVLYRDREYAEEGARKGIVGIFTLLGRNDDLVKRYHRRFEMALF